MKHVESLDDVRIYTIATAICRSMNGQAEFPAQTRLLFIVTGSKWIRCENEISLMHLWKLLPGSKVNAVNTMSMIC